MASAAAANLRRIARECKTLPRKAVEDASKAFTKSITKTLKRDTGGDQRLSGAPTRMRVQSKVQGETVVTATISPNKTAMAQWVWLEEGTGEPGPTAPKGTWSEPVSKELKTVTRAVRERLEAVMR